MSALATSLAISSQHAAACRAELARHSKSFDLASRLLPPARRDAAAALYAWCRRVDDAIDLAAPGAAADALAREIRVLHDVYAGAVQSDLVLTAFQDVVHACALPSHYPRELLEGMAMDVSSARYSDWADLDLYCYRVAGTVGLMMSHVLGVRRDGALVHAAHLGMGMQLTNIARDVAEDWALGRLYLPQRALREQGAASLEHALGGAPPEAVRGALARVTLATLDRAERYYASGDRGLRDLSWRSALGVRTARQVYAEIGAIVRARGGDPLSGRAVVSRPRKLALAAGSLLCSLVEAPGRALAGWRPVTIERIVKYPDDVLGT